MFIHEDFMLASEFAKELFHSYAEEQPVIDYHCHLIPAEIAEDKRWENITQIWLYGDHYKWRQMRTAGIGEEYCTGDKSDYDKFIKYAELMPQALRNPLYHWTHLELKKYFGITELLNPDTADMIWHKTKEIISSPEFSARSLIRKSNVELICTTDDPVDSLEHHRTIAEDANFAARVLPAWRPDKVLAVNDKELFKGWLSQLEEASGITVSNLDDLMNALRNRHDFFHSAGCRLSDRGVAKIIADDFTEAEIKTIFDKVLAGQDITDCELRKYVSFMLYELAVMDAEKDWTMQIHYGVLRNNNTKMFKAVGPDTGFDSAGDFSVAEDMIKFLDRLATVNKLPKTILYPVNPTDNELIATMIGCFQDGTVPGKIQFGSAWWFLDQMDGMTKQIEAVSQLGLLSRFVGMLTDSRSFLSYTRHEYFRRLLCNILGNDMKNGLIPDDMELVGKMVADISYHNAKNYFGF